MRFALLASILCGVPSPPPDATTTRRGLVSTQAQAFSGLKTFDGGLFTPTLNGGAPVTATTAPMTLFVDGDAGSDNASCFDAGVEACATLAGALAKVQKDVEHQVLIDLAGGNYVTPSLEIANRVGAAGVMVIRGAALADAQGIMGPVTGTATAWTQTTPIWNNTMTDSSATWTSNALKGLFLCDTTITSTCAPAEIRTSCRCRPITSNTGTVITFLGNYPSSPAAGHGYAIRAPATVLTLTGSDSTGLLRLRTTGKSTGHGSTWAGRSLALSELTITSSGSSSTLVSVQNSTPIMVSSRLVVASGALGALSVAAGGFVSGSTGLNGGGLVLDGAAQVSGGVLNFIGTSPGDTMGGQFVASLFARGPVPIRSSGNALISGTMVLEATTTGGSPIEVGALGSPHLNVQARLLCPAGSTAPGLHIGNTALFGANGYPVAHVANGGFEIQTCSTGVRLSGPVTYRQGTGTASSCTSVTTCLQVDRGAHLELNSPAWTMSGVTTEASVDGTAYTIAAIDGFAPQVTPLSPYGSWIGR